MAAHADRVPGRSKSPASERVGAPRQQPEQRVGPARLLELQVAAGNQAVRSLLRSANVQRDAPLSAPTGDGTASADVTQVGEFGGLHSARWLGDALLEATAADKARVHAGSDPAAVELVQQALLDVQAVNGHRYDLGISGPAHNGVDGLYGAKTGAAVQAFKRDEQLGFTQFTDVGPRTMHRLDDLLDGSGPGPGPVPKDNDPDEPQRFEPPAGPGPAPGLTPAAGALVQVLVALLNRKPPDMLILFATLKAVDIPLTYTTLHQLHDDHPAQFAVLKTQLRGLSVPLAARLRVIANGVENDDDMGVLTWKRSQAAPLAALPQADQDAIALAYDPRHPTLLKVQASAGFGKMTSTERDQFLLYVGGANIISRRAGRLLGTVIDGPKFDRTAAKSFRDFRKAEESVGPLTEVKNEFIQRPVSKTTPVDAGKHVYQSRPAGVASESCVVTIGAPTDVDKTTVSVFRPKADKLNATLNYHTFNDIEKGLSTLPPRNAKEIKRVDVEPGFNPQDAHWKIAYKDKNFTSYMTAGADQVVRVFPSKGSVPSDTWMEGSFIHESGHIISERAFGRASTSPKWKPWKDAMKSDVIHPSDYAKKSPAEDFSEMVQLYRMEKGRRREQEIRKMFPARVAILDTMNLT